MKVHGWGNQDLNQALVPEEEEEGEDEDDDDDDDDGDDTLKLEAPVLCAVHRGILAEDVARFLKVSTQDFTSPPLFYYYYYYYHHHHHHPVQC